MRDLFKDRLEEEERLGRPLIRTKTTCARRWRIKRRSRRACRRSLRIPTSPARRPATRNGARRELRIATEDRRQRRHEPRGRRRGSAARSPEKREEREEKEERGAVDADHSAGEAHQRLSTEVIRPKENGHESPVSMTEGNPPADMMPTVAAEPAYRPPARSIRA